MSARAIRWLLFGALVIALPFPMLGPFAALVPPIRYAILLSAASLVALVEGAAGAVPMIVGLLALNLVVSLALSWAIAWAASRVLGALASTPVRNSVVVGAVCVGLLLATALPFYRTPFGRAPTASLLGLLP